MNPRPQSENTERPSLLTQTTKPIVLVVDDLKSNRELLVARLQGFGYEVREAIDGIDALAEIERQEPDLILLDISMPRMDGLTLCRRLKSHPTRRLIPVILLTALNERETKRVGIEAGADEFLSKPFDPEELLSRTRVLLRDRELNKRLDGSDSVVLALARIVEARDLYTVHHAERVGASSREMGRAMGLPEVDLEVLYRGGILHDLGKALIPSEVLLKKGQLTADEWDLMRSHAVQGAVICAPLQSTRYYLPIIRHHHEWVSGAGYPDHLVGNDIPLGARLAAIADAWDAMIHNRPYRGALDPDEARRRMLAGAGTQWDAGFVEVFLDLIDRDILPSVAAA